MRKIKLSSLFGMRPPDAEYGTVPYFKHYATYWRRSRYVLLLPMLAMLASLVLAASTTTFAVTSVLDALIAFALGMGWQSQTTSMRNNERQAWQVEAETTMQAMANSGLYDSFADVVTALRDGPPPPGFKHDEWRALHDEMIADMRRKELGGNES